MIFIFAFMAILDQFSVQGAYLRFVTKIHLLPTWSGLVRELTIWYQASHKIFSDREWYNLPYNEESSNLPFVPSRLSTVGTQIFFSVSIISFSI